MPIPRAVQDQADRADAILNGLQTGNQRPPEPPAPAPQPAPQPASPPIDSAPQTPASAPVPQGLEHQFKVLQGKYNAEVPRLHAQLSESTAALEQANRLVEQLKTQLQAAPQPQSLVLPEEIQEHGENLIDVIRRAAREELQARDQQINELQTQVKQLSNGVGTLKTKTFLETVSERVPDWALINDDAQFHSWLGEIDELSGELRQSLLTRAHAAEDGVRAAAIFTAFKRARDSWAAQANSALNGQVVPAAGGAGGTPAGVSNPGARVWLKAEVNKFYEDVRLRRITGAQQAAVEAEIQLAMAEGRIR